MNVWVRIPLLAITLGAALAVAATAVVTGAYFYVEPDLPEASELRQFRGQTPLSVVSRDRRLMQQFGQELRTPADLEDIPLILRNGVLAAEDDEFYQHRGIDVVSTIRAVINYGISIVTGSEDRVPGGSTITQQITRTTDLLPRAYALGRKVSEIFLAFRIENEFEKDEIFEIYLNTYFFGQRSFGVVSAARKYFDKDLDELTLSEAAIIAGIPTAPSRNNPYTSPENAASRRAYVLRRMHELEFITTEEREAALAEPIESALYGLQLELDAGYAAQAAYDWCLERLGKTACDQEGLTIVTTIDSRLQRAADRALRDALEAYDRNHGYRGPLGQVDFEALGLVGAGASNGATEVLDTLLADYPNQFDSETAIVTAVADTHAEIYLASAGQLSVGFDAISWARRWLDDNRRGPYPDSVADVLSPGDIVRFRQLDGGSWELSQVPDESAAYVQGALVSLDPMDGAIVAMTGGYDFEHSEFNRATQALRQPGSSFKPFLYLAALASDYTLASIINDAPFYECSNALERCRSVENFENDFFGPNRLRVALRNSWNASADRVIREIGAGYVGDYVERFGLDPTRGERNASLALGSLSVTPLQLANAYSILANGGHAVGIRPEDGSAPAPYLVERLEAPNGDVLYDARHSVLTVCAEPLQAEEAQRGASREQLIERPSELFGPLRCAEQVESPQRIHLITDVMKDVVRMTSGARAGRAFPGRRDLAGKTGTTNDARDAWFAGFNAGIVAVARVGFDDDARELGVGEQGGRTAIPAWIDYMRVALDGMPDNELARPPGIIELRIDPESGLLASDCNRDAIWEKFLFETVPEREPDSNCSSLLETPLYGPDSGLPGEVELEPGLEDQGGQDRPDEQEELDILFL